MNRAIALIEELTKQRNEFADALAIAKVDLRQAEERIAELEAQLTPKE